jgi:hypothetical protein
LVGNAATDSGGGALRCTLNNCTLIGNVSRYGGNGGGASGSTLNNCTVSGNYAGGYNGSGGYGGGASDCTLNNCAISGNSATNDGGGAAYCTLNNCTLTANSATNRGGGVFGCNLNNCIVQLNTAPQEANYDSSSTLNYCCTTPQPTNGVGSITNAPMFVDQTTGNLRLQSSSPCINAGLNAFVPAGPDLDGHPRVVGGAVDIGAYEFQSATSVISYAWLQQYNLPTDGSADFVDSDGDGLNNWQEWHCGTDPTSALSVLRLYAPATEGAHIVVTWQSVAGMNYFLERATNLAASPAFTSLATAIPGQPGTTTYNDTNALGSGPRFYRVGVSAP